MAQTLACGIDIGTHHIKVMVCDRVEENGRITPKIVATASSESRGLRHGYVVNTAEVTHGLEEAFADIAKQTGIKIKKAFLGVGGVGVSSYSHSASVVVSRADGEVSDLDVERVLKICEDSIPPQYSINKKILHTIPFGFRIDGRQVMSKPQGMKGQKLEARVLFIQCVEQQLNELVQAVNDAGVDVEDVMAAPLAASLVALTKAQKHAGCVLTNIGAETVSVAVFDNSIPISVDVFPIGGMDITHDIALGLRIPIEEAETIKKGKEHTFSKRKLDEIIAARLSDIFDLIENHLKKIGKSGLLPAGIILTGGTTGIASIEEVARTALRLPARIIKTLNIKDDKSPVRDSYWSIAYGLCVFGINQESSDAFGPRILNPIRRGFIQWVKQFLP